MRFFGSGPHNVPEPTSRTTSSTFVEPARKPRRPTVTMPSRMLAMPSVMINGFTRNTPMARPLTNPTAMPTPRAMASAGTVPRPLSVAAR